MGYVLVSADFPGVTSDQRNKIYECLKSKGWEKFQEASRDISTTWQGDVANSTEAYAIGLTKKHFDECAAPFGCKPKLAIHYGPSKPTRHNLV